MSNLPQMAFILRAKQGRRAVLAAQVRETDAELATLERDYAVAVGLPTLRGEKLLKAIDDEVALARKREA